MSREMISKYKGVFFSEPIQYSEIRQLLDTDAPTILEIGANNGNTTLGFLNTFSGAVVHAFEPDPRAIEKWKKKVRSNRAILWPMAIGANEGVCAFYMSDGREDEGHVGGYDKSGSIRPPKNHLIRHPSVLFKREITVQVRTLDDWAREQSIGLVDFIWADVQGAEQDLIDGARGTLSRTRYFYTEYSNQELYEGQITLEQILEVLPGFEISRLYRGDVLLKNNNIL